MATTTKKKQESAPAKDTLTDMQQQGFTSLAEFNSALLETAGNLSAQMAKFIAQRIKEDVKVQHELLQCKSLKDIQNTQLQFFERTFRQYQESAARMMDIGTHVLEGRVSK